MKLETRSVEGGERKQTTYVFVYGTLKNGYGNNRLLRNETFIGEAVTIPHDFTMIDGGFPYVLLGGVFHIKGELWATESESVLSSLDAFEGVRYDHYKRHTVEVKCDGEVYEALMYVASDNTRRMIEEHGTAHMVPKGKDNICEWNRVR